MATLTKTDAAFASEIAALLLPKIGVPAATVTAIEAAINSTVPTLSLSAAPTPAEIVSVIGAVLTVAGTIVPALKVAEPFVVEAMEIAEAWAGGEIAAGRSVPDGRGGMITKEQAVNPHTALNPDGTFKEGLFGL